MSDIIRMYWDCPMCGRKGIISTKRQCSCGYIFGTESSDKFHMPMPGEEIVEVEDDTNPDELLDNWRCDFCGTYNPYSARVCKTCGHPRDESSKSYFTITGKEKSTVSKSVSEDDIYDGSTNIYEDFSKTPEEISKELKQTRKTMSEVVSEVQENKKKASAEYNEPYSVNNRYDINQMNVTKEKYRQKREQKYADINQRYEEDKKEREERNREKKKKNLKRIGIVGIIVVLFGLFLAFMLQTKEHTYIVKGKTWNRSIAIEKQKTFSESGWTLPDGARLNYTRREIRSYEQVPDGYETVPVTRYKSVPKTETYYEDLGNGNAQRRTRTTYEQVPYTDYEQRTKYKSVPVYDTKYYYDIDRYVYERSVITKGTDDEPYWGEVNLGALERQGSKSEEYKILFDDGKEKSINVKQDVWNQYQQDNEITLLKNRFGMYSLPKEEKKEE